MIGRTLGHYRITEQIGAGGMGVVYRARDEHLNRDVAVKVLPAGTLADEAARQRFRKEALALSKLNHPNIQTVFDFDTQDGVDFLVTEYVPGVALNERVAGKGLSEKEVLRLGQQLAEGLAAAHEQGIIHRDLKPSNLRVTPDGRLKILDFGVAKLLGPVSATAATETGTRTLAGTPLYMAPEQRRGEPVDARSDLYAGGLVLWEMATGKPPVAGRALSGSVSPELQRIVGKCLEEDPENRYQSAKELTVDLRRTGAPVAVPAAGAAGLSSWVRWRYAVAAGASLVVLLGVLVGLNVGGLRERLFGAGAPSSINSLAVLPLKNLMGDPEQDYFVEGTHEALTAELSKISALKVISRTSTNRYKNTDKLMPQIARELGVDGLIEGSVLREGDQVRITVQLIHGPSDRHLWAQSFDRELRGILALQSEVAGAIARQVQVNLRPEEEKLLASARPVSPAAYDAWLRGLAEFTQTVEPSLKRCIAYANEAIAIDPSYAPAHALAAHCYIRLAVFTNASPQDTFPKAKAAALRAIESDEWLGEGHAALGIVLERYEWNWAGADQELKRALQLNPSSARNQLLYSVYLGSLGRHDDALLHARRAEQLSPLWPLVIQNVAMRLYQARRYDEAIAQAKRATELVPNDGLGFLVLGLAYEANRMYDEAVMAFERAAELDLGAESDLGRVYALAGRRDDARRILNHSLLLERTSYVPPTAIAGVYTGLGEVDEALSWLERGYKDRDARMVLLKTWPVWDPLRSDPRFQALLRRMNFPEN